MARSPGRDYLRSPRIERSMRTGRPQVVPTVAAIVLLVLAVAACSLPAPQAATSPVSPLPAPSATTGPLALTIVHSNDTWGYLDPCG